MKHLLLADTRGNELCELGLATNQRTHQCYIAIRKRGHATIYLPIEQAYQFSDLIVALAEATEHRNETL